MKRNKEKQRSSTLIIIKCFILYVITIFALNACFISNSVNDVDYIMEHFLLNSNNDEASIDNDTISLENNNDLNLQLQQQQGKKELNDNVELVVEQPHQQEEIEVVDLKKKPQQVVAIIASVPG